MSILAGGDRVVFDEHRQVYVLDGRDLDEAAVLALLGSGRLARVPWTLRHYTPKQKGTTPP